MQVPNQWWIIRKASDVVELARLPPTDEEGRALLVRLEKRLIPDAVLHNPTSLKQIGDAIIEMPRASTTENVNGSNASLLEYRVSQPPERQGHLYMFWSFPKEGLTISAVDIPESYRSYLYELLKTVEWSEIGGGGRQLLDTELRQRSTKGGFCQISGLSVVSLSRRRLMLSRRLCVLMKLLKAA